MNDFEAREVLFRSNESKTDVFPYCRVVDDTAHFLFSCVSYKEHRRSFNGNKTFRHKTFRQQDGGRRFGNKMLPKRLSPAVKTFRHQRRFGNKKNNL